MALVKKNLKQVYRSSLRARAISGLSLFSIPVLLRAALEQSNALRSHGRTRKSAVVCVWSVYRSVLRSIRHQEKKHQFVLFRP